MRSLLLVLAIVVVGCKDKTTPETPKSGSVAHADADPTPPSRLRAPTLAGTPPVKTTPLDASKIALLAKHDVDGWTRQVRLADAKGLEVQYTSIARPTLRVTVQAARCFDCLPMKLDRWQAKSDALRALIAPELRDRVDTTWELGITDLAGAPIVWTYHVAFASPAFSTAATVYFNDGINMIRVVAESIDVPASRDAMVAAAPRDDLVHVAKAFLDDFVHVWR
jgi:hypothetical protein